MSIIMYHLERFYIFTKIINLGYKNLNTFKVKNISLTTADN